MDAKLILVVEGKADRAIPLKKTLTSIGREKGNDIRLKSSQVSRLHCAIHKQGNLLRVTDMGSANGVFVNGKKIESATLRPNDRLTIGSMTFRVDYKGVPSPAAVPAKQAAVDLKGSIFDAPGGNVDELETGLRTLAKLAMGANEGDSDAAEQIREVAQRVQKQAAPAESEMAVDVVMSNLAKLMSGDRVEKKKPASQ
jgi:hypothetical protein